MRTSANAARNCAGIERLLAQGGLDLLEGAVERFARAFGSGLAGAERGAQLLGVRGWQRRREPLDARRGGARALGRGRLRWRDVWRTASAPIVPMKNRLSASEPISSQREERS